MSDTHEHPARPLGYEKRDANVFKTGVVTVLAIVLLTIFAVWLDEFFVATQTDIVQETVLAPVSKDLRELRASEGRVLNSYALIDSTEKKYRIPIERAMEMMAAEASER